MLEKMGWSKGKGLGANNQGMTEHVRVDLKTDLTGIGFDKSKVSEKWTEQQENFNDFLQTLQKDTNSITVPIENTDLSTLSGESLEKKSQFSRTRVHYKKFTRGKDVNKYSSKDLANIFGKKELEGTYSRKIGEEDNVVLDPIGSADKRGGIFTVKGGNNMTDYFAGLAKSASFKSQKRLRSEFESESEVRVGFGFYLDIKPEPSEVENFENVTPKKQKRSKNFSADSTENVAFENPCEPEVKETNSEVEDKKLKKKKKKSLEGNSNEDDFAFENPCLMSVDQIDSEVKVEDFADGKKSKKNKKKSVESPTIGECVVKKQNDFAFENPSLLSVNEIDLEINIKSEPQDYDYEVTKKSKKNKIKSVDDNSIGDSVVKKENDFAFENPCLLSVTEIDSEVKIKSKVQDYEVSKKSKKNKKKSDANSVKNDFAFENPSLLSVNEIDSEINVKSEPQDYEVTKKSKKNKIKSVDISSSEDFVVKKENDFTFENPCLLSVNEIDSEIKVKSENENYEVSKKSKKNKKKQIVEDSFAFENPCLLSVNEIDSNVEIEDCKVREKSKKKKKSCLTKIENDLAFENPCLLGVDKIDLTVKDEPMEVEDLEIKYEGIPQHLKKKNKNKNDFVFYNTGMLDIKKIDTEFEELQKKKKNKTEKKEFVFDNPCLLDVIKIDSAIDNSESQEATPKKLKKKNQLNSSKENSLVVENENPSAKKKSGILKEGACNGAEFEVKRKELGVVNTGLDIADEKRKKRVTFNDKVEYNTDVHKKKNRGAKLDRFEVENSKMKKKWQKKQSKNKDDFTKAEVKELYRKNKIFQFQGSNIDSYKGYGVA